MEPILSGFLSKLAIDLTTSAFKALGKKAAAKLKGSEKEQAIQRCLQAGITVMLASIEMQSDAQLEHVKHVLEKKFKTEDVGMEVALLLDEKHIDQPALIEVLEKDGFDSNTLPKLNLEQAISALENGFLHAAAQEPALQDILKIKIMLKGINIQSDMRDSINEIVKINRQGFKSLQLLQGQLLAELQNNEIRTVRLIVSGTNGGHAGADWQAYYLKTLMKRCDTLDLTPIDDTHPMGPQQNHGSDVHLSDVFVNLHLKNLSRLPEEDITTVIQKQGKTEQLEKAERHMESDKEKERLPIQAIEAVAAVQRLVILGQPGGGKSTLANHLVTQLAARRLDLNPNPEKMPGWPENEKQLPVLIVLRRFAAWLNKQAHNDKNSGCVWDYLKEQMHQDGCEEAFSSIRNHLIEEGGVLFFDGLDEIHESEDNPLRTRIVKAINHFASDNDQCKIVITCREYSYKKDDGWRLPEARFPVVELALFDDKQVEHFTQIWYKTIGPGKSWDEKRCTDEATNLFTAIKDYPHLHELAQYPLLLTLMAQVHGRDGYLPKDRADLYERAVNLLLAHWENRIVRDVSGSLKVEPSLIMELGVHSDILRTALENVAFLAHEQQEKAENRGDRTADIAKEDLRDELNSALNDLNKAEKVMEYIQNRAGLLQARDKRTYTFPHRTFQEYLTACYIMKQDNFDEMLHARLKRDLPWWSEVYLLAAGRVRKIPRNIAELADVVLPETLKTSAINETTAEQARLVAQTLIETDFAKNISDKKISRYNATFKRCQENLLAVVHATENLAPKERARSGDVLARLGDPRFNKENWFLPDDELLGFAKIPTGVFKMAEKNELHDVHLPDYYIARFPVTVAQFRAFVEASGHKPGDTDSLRGVGNHPVRWVSWHESLKYCNWLTETLRNWQNTPSWLKRLLRYEKWHFTLPSEAEWEKAARGENGQIYPWGDEVDANKANYADTGIGSTSTVGCFANGVSPFKCEEISGNVWEWTRSIYGNYPYPTDANELKERENLESSESRVVRGGSFYLGRSYVRCAHRYRYDPNYRDVDIGFRVVLRPLR